MTDTEEPIFGAQLAAWRRKIDAVNMPGNVEGLFARYVLGDTAQLQWKVDPETSGWLEVNAHRLDIPCTLAVLGYTTAAQPTLLADFADVLVTGIEGLMRRDPYPGDRLTFLYSAPILIGVYLAGRALQDRLPSFLPWLRDVLGDSRRKPNDAWLDLIHLHLQAELAREPAEIPELASMSGHELAAAFFMLTSGTGTAGLPVGELRGVQQRAAQTFLRANPDEVDDRKAALWLLFGERLAIDSADQLVITASQVGLVLRRFPAALRRWRWDDDTLKDPIRWRIDAEREVQDILWIMLRTAFDDVVDEDTLAKLGRSSYRADFGLSRLALLIEVKYVRTSGEFKKIEQEVMIDSVAYLKDERYKQIIVFIYDDSSSAEQHDLTCRTLFEVPGIVDVIIVSRPGIIPPADLRSGRTMKDGSRSSRKTGVVSKREASR
ncbi:PD-(D/E)XK nuclease domain-containing protein [Nocardia brasiliensis]